MTMVCAPADVEDVVLWTRTSLLPLLTDDRARSPRLALVETGEAADEPEAVSLALQFEHDDNESCRAWTEERLIPALAQLERRFGERVLLFRTLLRQLPL